MILVRSAAPGLGRCVAACDVCGVALTANDAFDRFFSRLIERTSAWGVGGCGRNEVTFGGGPNGRVQIKRGRAAARSRNNGVGPWGAFITAGK
jgi:hypothetical protein